MLSLFSSCEITHASDCVNRVASQEYGKSNSRNIFIILNIILYMPLCRITFTRKDCPGTEFSYYDKFDDTMKIGHVEYLMAVYKRVMDHLRKANGSQFDKLIEIEDLDQSMK